MSVEETSRSRPNSPAPRDVRYDAATIWLHWSTVGLVVALWVIGQVTDWLPRSLGGGVWSTHVALGFVLALILSARIAWRARFGRTLPAANIGALHAIANATHYTLYLLLLAVVITGIFNASYRGFNLFGAWPLPQFGSGDRATRNSINQWHELAANLTVVAAVIHAAAALVHHYVWRDQVLERMRP